MDEIGHLSPKNGVAGFPQRTQRTGRGSHGRALFICGELSSGEMTGSVHEIYLNGVGGGMVPSFLAVRNAVNWLRMSSSSCRPMCPAQDSSSCS